MSTADGKAAPRGFVDHAVTAVRTTRACHDHIYRGQMAGAKYGTNCARPRKEPLSWRPKANSTIRQHAYAVKSNR